MNTAFDISEPHSDKPRLHLVSNEPVPFSFDEVLDFFCEDRPWHLQAILPRKGAKALIEFADFPLAPSRTVDAEKWCRYWNDLGYGIYFGINPLKRSLGSKSSKDEVSEARFLWVDVDPVTTLAGAELDTWRGETLESIRQGGALRIAPTAIIDSGRGYWLFWKLAVPVILDGNGPATQRVESHGKGIEKLFAGADNCRNVDRIARLPGFVNKKTMGLAKLVELHPDRTFALTDFPHEEFRHVEKREAIDTVDNDLDILKFRGFLVGKYGLVNGQEGYIKTGAILNKALDLGLSQETTASTLMELFVELGGSQRTPEWSYEYLTAYVERLTHSRKGATGCDSVMVWFEDLAKYDGLEEVTRETSAGTPESQCNWETVKKAIIDGPLADAIKIWASFLGRFTPNALERSELVHLLSERVKEGVNDIKATMNEYEEEWAKRQNEKAFAEKRAASVKHYSPFDCPDLEAAPVMRKWDGILSGVKTVEPPMRGANNWPVHISHTDIPGMHILTSLTANGGADSKLAPPKNYLLKNHDVFSLEIELSDYVTFYTVDALKKVREVAPSGRFITHYLNYDRSSVPKVYAVMTMPIVLPDRTILSTNGLDKERHLVLKINPEMLKYLPARADCTPEAVAEAYRFLCDDWFCDVLADADGKAILIAFALSIIERCLFDCRPAFFISAALRGGGKTTAFNMVSMAVLGEQTAARAWSSSNEERRKAMLSFLMTGAPCITWDNIPKGTEIQCAHVERAITSEIYVDRILGVSADGVAPAYSIMSFTGNNIQPHEDMASRSLVVNLATDRPDPENRAFTRSDPVTWTQEHRGEILRALYTLLLGNPINDRIPKTRFKRWMKLVGEAVEFGAELYGDKISFETSFKEVEKRDSANSEKADILMTLNKLFPDGQAFTASDICVKLRESEMVALNSSPKVSETAEMHDLRAFCLRTRKTVPTSNGVNKIMKGIANGPTATDFGIVTLKMNVNNDSGKVHYWIDYKLDDVDTSWFEPVEDAPVYQPGATIGGAGAQM